MPRTLTETRPTVNQNVPNRIDGIAVLPDRAVRDPSQIVGFRVNVDPSDPGQRRSYRDRLGSIVGVGSDGTASIRVNPQHESSAALLYDIQHNLGSTFSLHLDPPRRMADLIVGDSPAQPSARVVESADFQECIGGHVDSYQDQRRRLLRNPAKILSSWRTRHLTY